MWLASAVGLRGLLLLNPEDRPDVVDGLSLLSVGVRGCPVDLSCVVRYGFCVAVSLRAGVKSCSHSCR